MPDSDSPARRRAAPKKAAAAEAEDTADQEVTERTDADDAQAERERRAELERLRHKLQRKFH